MFASFSDIKNKFEKYLELAADEEIIITLDGRPIAKLVGIHYICDRLVGLIPPTDEDSARNERLTRQ